MVTCALLLHINNKLHVGYREQTLLIREQTLLINEASRYIEDYNRCIINLQLTIANIKSSKTYKINQIENKSLN